MTEWHRHWQEQVPNDRREVTMGSHRADMVLLDGRVVEVQHSPISPQVIVERVAHYGADMIWIFDARSAWEPREPQLSIQRDTNTTVTWTWRRGVGRRRLAGNATTYFDTGRFLLDARKGHIVDYESMRDMLAAGVPLPEPSASFLDSLPRIGNTTWKWDEERRRREAEERRRQEEEQRRADAAAEALYQKQILEQRAAAARQARWADPRRLQELFDEDLARRQKKGV